MNTRNMLGYAGPSPQQIGQALMQPAGSTQDVNAMLSQVPVQKGNVFPLTTYGDNSTRFDPSAGITGALIQALTAPSRAYNEGMTREQMVEEGANFATTLGVGGMAIPRPRGSIGMGGKPSGLDMSHAARMQRAADMGFDTNMPLYHGTSADFSAFAPNKAGSVTGAKSAQLGTWLVDNPSVAAGYADNAAGNAVTKLIRQSERLERSGDFDGAERVMAEAEALEAAGPSGHSILPTYARGKLKTVDMDGVQYDPDDVDLSSIVKAAKQDGYDGVRLTNFSDDATYGTYTPATHVVMFSPSNIRSVNARFDPAKAASSDLLAANASPLPFALQQYYSGGDR